MTLTIEYHHGLYYAGPARLADRLRLGNFAAVGRTAQEAEARARRWLGEVAED